MINYTKSPIEVNFNESETIYTRSIITHFTNDKTWKEVLTVEVEENDLFDLHIVSIYDAHKETTKISEFKDITEAHMYALSFIKNYNAAS